MNHWLKVVAVSIACPVAIVTSLGPTRAGVAAEEAARNPAKSANVTNEVPAPTDWVEGKDNLAHGFVWIKPGSFVMGSPRSEVDAENVEGPQTTVTITRGFW